MQNDSQVCSVCETENEGNSKFCIKCRAILKPVLICIQCKSENDTGAKFCFECGKELPAKELPTLEYQRKQNLKLKIGLLFLAVTFILLIVLAIYDLKNGKYLYSTKDGWFWKEVPKVNQR